MKIKYKTRPIDFTGCNPVIKDAIKQGLSIHCNVSREMSPEKEKAYISYYDIASKRYVDTNGRAWDYAEPIPKKQKVKSAQEIFKWLAENDFEIKMVPGMVSWHPPKGSGYMHCFTQPMLEYCGKEPCFSYEYIPEWLEDDENEDNA